MATEQITDDELLALHALANTRGGVKLGSSVLLRLLNTVDALRTQLAERCVVGPDEVAVKREEWAALGQIVTLVNEHINDPCYLRNQLVPIVDKVSALRRQLEERTNCAPEFDVNKLDGLEGATLDNHGQDKDNIMDTTVTRPSVPKIAAALCKGIGHRFGENHWKRVSSSISQERLDAEAHERRLIPSPDRLRLPFSL